MREPTSNRRRFQSAGIGPRLALPRILKSSRPLILPASRICLAAALILTVAGPAWAQQRPLVTEDPETIGAGRVLIEIGADHERDRTFPVSGLTGDLWSVPTLGVSIGVSSIAEIQVDGSPYTRMRISRRDPTAPLADRVTATGDIVEGVEDLIVGMKLRLMSESAVRPSIGLRLATKLPNSDSENGLEPDTTDFFASLLGGKTTGSTRIVVNAGLGILGDPTQGDRQTDMLTYGLSLAHAVRAGVELVAEANGRLRLSGGDPDPNGENRTTMRAGARYTFGPGRIDAAVLLGATDNDPSVGFTFGYTHVFNAFQVP
jgi:hypothetical protein